MLFNTKEFAVFFIIVYLLYLLLNHKWQNRMLLLASYIFYGAWDWRFLSLVFASTILDYFCGLKIYESKDVKRRKLFLLFSVFGNLGILGFFKYFNFFAASLRNLLHFFGFSIQFNLLHIILPVGISFYTFQTMSYAIDVYRNKLIPTKNLLDFALFVTYFPQLVAGPIERASHLLPQVLSPRKLRLDGFYEGCYLIFWGLFQKIFIADNLAQIVDPFFASSPPYNGAKVLLALYAFAFQIYCDFAGYSNMARGLGKCMGFDIMVNFNLPYFATNPREFWQRWHISLSTFLRDYLYIPLGGNKKGKFITYRNLAITMLLGGIWHGAAWTFVIWGLYQGILLIIHRLVEPFIKNIPSPKHVFTQKIWFYLRIVFFFHLICLGWLIFRANSVTQGLMMLRSLFTSYAFNASTAKIAAQMFYYLWLLLLIGLLQFVQKNGLAVLTLRPFYRVAIYVVMLLLFLLNDGPTGQMFIYFQF